MKKRFLAAFLATAMVCGLLTGCHDSSKNEATIDIKKTSYDPKEAVKDFEFGELNDVEKDYVVEMGYNNCDHMVASIIGEKAGIYEAMGLNVNLTKSGETTKALISGAMDVGYIGVGAAGLSCLHARSFLRLRAFRKETSPNRCLARLLGMGR